MTESTEYDPAIDVRAGAHSDYGSITLLFRLPGQAGLEVQTPAGDFVSVPVNPNGLDSPPILVNIGDLLSYWTDGLLRSTVHRVVFPREAAGAGDRYSIAYFCHPLDEAELVPVPSEVVREFGGRSGRAGGCGGGVLTARDHLDSRLALTYGSRSEQTS